MTWDFFLGDKYHQTTPAKLLVISLLAQMIIPFCIVFFKTNAGIAKLLGVTYMIVYIGLLFAHPRDLQRMRRETEWNPTNWYLLSWIYPIGLFFLMIYIVQRKLTVGKTENEKEEENDDTVITTNV